MNRSAMLLLCSVLTASGVLAACSGATNPTPPSAGDVPLDTNSYGIPWNPNVAYGALKDSRDGLIYRTVQIGTQTWMAQNLNHAVDSSWCYADSIESCRKYGRLYQWAVAMGLSEGSNANSWNGSLPRQGICPSGWHLPSDPEWSILLNSVDSASSSIKLKSAAGWYMDAGTDVYGFRALPGGDREVDALVANLRYLSYAAEGGYSNAGEKKKSFSVRCLKD